MATLDLLIDALATMRRTVAAHDHDALLDILGRASEARRAMSERAPSPEGLVEVRIPVPDRTGVIAEITVLVTELGINIVDLEIAHSVEGDHGILVVVVDTLSAPTLLATLSRPGLPRRQRPGGSELMGDPAEFTVAGGRALTGTVRVPGDKSISHRALLLAALAEGTSTILGLSPPETTWPHRPRRRGPRSRGGEDGPTHRRHGGRSRLRPRHPLDLGNSGTGMRLLTGVVAGIAGATLLTGDDSLPPSDGPGGRAARADGGDGERPRRAVPAAARVPGGALQGIDYTPPMASAQVKSAVLLAGLAAEGETVVHEPVATRTHTEEMLAAAGADIDVEPGGGRAGGPGAGASSLEPGTFTVPGDPSQAAFWVVGGHASSPGSLVPWPTSPGPERLGFLGVLRRMGATIEVEEAGDDDGSVTSYHCRCTARWSRRRRSPPSTRCPSWRWPRPWPTGPPGSGTWASSG